MTAIAQTAQGKLEGRIEDGLSVFRGVRFAQAPLGQLRFRAPQPPESWQGVRSAAEFGPIAPQVPNQALDDLIGGDVQEQDEDCLYLNVWTPGLDGGERPVMVWIHGGGFTIGSGSESYYSGANLAARGDVVVVTINYRLGALGFLHLPALGETNFGMRDQVQALRWVRQNIAAFGGDPGNVTIFGESAGGMSVGSLMGSPEAAGLFHKAIPQSGAGHHSITLERAEEVGRQFADALGVNPGDAAGLRGAPAGKLQEASAIVEAAAMAAIGEGAMPDMSFQPVVDGEFLETSAIEAVRGGRSSEVPLLIGVLDEEWKLFDAMMPGDPPNEEDAVARIDGFHGNGRSAYDAYREARAARGESTDPHEIFLQAAGDRLFRIPADRLAVAQAARQPDTYCYLFDWKSPALDGALGACHALDIPFTFGTHGRGPDFAGTGPEADELAETVMDGWLAFARTGNPSSRGREWPRFSEAERAVTVLGADTRTEHAWREPERRAWDGYFE